MSSEAQQARLKTDEAVKTFTDDLITFCQNGCKGDSGSQNLGTGISGSSSSSTSEFSSSSVEGLSQHARMKKITIGKIRRFLLETEDYGDSADKIALAQHTNYLNTLLDSAAKESSPVPDVYSKYFGTISQPTPGPEGDLKLGVDNNGGDVDEEDEDEDEDDDDTSSMPSTTMSECPFNSIARMRMNPHPLIRSKSYPYLESECDNWEMNWDPEPSDAESTRGSDEDYSFYSSDSDGRNSIRSMSLLERFVNPSFEIGLSGQRSRREVLNLCRTSSVPDLRCMELPFDICDESFMDNRVGLVPVEAAEAVVLPKTPMGIEQYMLMKEMEQEQSRLSTATH